MFSAAAKFRVYLGPQAGCQFDLPVGEFTIGNGGQAALIFSDLDLQPVHARIIVHSALEISIAPEEGQVRVNDAEISGETPLEPGALIAIGASLLCLQPADGQWPTHEQILGTFKTTEAEASEAEAEAAPDAPENGADKDAGKPAAAEKSEAEDTPAAEGGAAPLRKYVFAGAAVVLALMLFALVLGPRMLGPHNVLRDDAETLQAALQELHLPGLRITGEDNSLHLDGSVPSQADYNRLLEALPPLRTSLALHIDVRDDLILGIERAFATEGFTVRASYLEDRSVGISGYMRDPYVEADVVNAVEKLYHRSFKRRVVYQNQLELYLKSYLSSVNSKQIVLEYDPGRIVYSGSLSLDDQETINLVKNELEKQLSVPLNMVSRDHGGPNFAPSLMIDPMAAGGVASLAMDRRRQENASAHGDLNAGTEVEVALNGQGGNASAASVDATNGALTLWTGQKSKSEAKAGRPNGRFDDDETDMPPVGEDSAGAPSATAGNAVEVTPEASQATDQELKPDLAVNLDMMSVPAIAGGVSGIYGPEGATGKDAERGPNDVSAVPIMAAVGNPDYNANDAGRDLSDVVRSAGSNLPHLPWTSRQSQPAVQLVPLKPGELVSVTVEPLRFVALRNGQKYFEGATLPSGFVIDKITSKELTLNKEGKVVKYELK